MDRESYLQVNRPANECALCGASLVDQGHHPSVIEEQEGGEAARRDFCSTCWSNLTDQKYFSFWLVKRARPEPNRRLAKAERNEVLWRLFSALSGRRESQTEPHLFLLAHLLMKYGILKWKANRHDEEGANWIVFEHPQTSEEFKVRERALGDEALVRTLKEIEDLVGKEVDPNLAGAVKL